LEKPFIIWTHRRCGGTNLAKALFSSSKFESVEHEPFNTNRCFGELQRLLASGSYVGDLKSDVRIILTNNILIKHCVEIIHQELNDVILEVSAELGYRHLFLYREVPTDRLFSLNYANITGIWGSKQRKVVDELVFSAAIDVESLILHERHCRRELSRMHSSLLNKNIEPVSISFEMLYQSNYDYSCILVRDVFNALGVPKTIITSDFLEAILKKGGQGTKGEYKKFKRTEELIERSKALGRFNFHKKIAETKIRNAQERGGIFELWGALPSVEFGKYHYTGIMVGSVETALLNGNTGQKIPLTRGLSSELVGLNYSEVKGASNARFITEAIEPVSFMKMQRVDDGP
jgi:hypothetical protein